eukprot:TRINITY_DN5303_c0_g1_i1.p2 TRINITY_DN5303_c0_g1~~TRINITY_DN5303_c0_g1_i1.p2  ORF type:complete len:171 (+),score=28.54 TRINITY_DN5303_c0_g1_i1:141-653(+)
MAACTEKTCLKSRGLNREEALQAFRLLDVNGDGKISRQELFQVAERLGLSVDGALDVEGTMSEADSDGDGMIDFEEFLNSSLTRSCGCSSGRMDGGCAEEDTDLRRAFELFDKDGNGTITVEELQQAMRMLSGESMTTDACRQMISRVDINGDGRVDFAEFKNMMAGALC